MKWMFLAATLSVAQSAQAFSRQETCEAFWSLWTATKDATVTGAEIVRGGLQVEGSKEDMVNLSSDVIAPMLLALDESVRPLAANCIEFRPIGAD